MFAAVGTHGRTTTSCVTTHTHTHTVCYSDYRRHRAPSVDRGFVLQPGCAAVGGAGAAWAGSSPALKLRPFAVAAHGQQTHTDVTAARHHPGHKALRGRWKAPGDTKKLPHSQSCVPLLQCFPTWSWAPRGGGALKPLLFINGIIKV